MIRSLLTTAVRAVPVVPDADQARTWLEDELTQPVYHQHASILQRIVAWLRRLFDGAPGLNTSPRVVALIVVLAIVLIAGVALWVAGPVRRARRLRAPGAVHAGDDRRTAAQLRADADAAADRGAWDDAVADRFRAIVRDLETRTVLDERPGRTAHEAVETASGRLPTVATDLRRAGRLFDDVVYGHVPAHRSDDAALREVDQRVGAARTSIGLVADSPDRLPL